MFPRSHSLLLICMLLTHLGSVCSNCNFTESTWLTAGVPVDGTTDLNSGTSANDDVTRNLTPGAVRKPTARLELRVNPTTAASNVSSGLDSQNCAGDCYDDRADNSTGQDRIEKLRSNIQFICQGILLPIIAIPGCVCNIINIYVLTRETKATANTRYLVGLSIADLSYLIVAIIGWLEYLLQVLDYSAYVVVVTGMRVYWIRSFGALVTGRVSNIIILVLSLERFLVVKFPFTAKNSRLSRHPIKIQIGLFVFITVVFLPNIFRREYVEILDPVSNRTSGVVARTKFDLNNESFLLIHTYFLLVFLRLLPVFLVVVLNLAIVVTLKFSRVSLGTDQNSEGKRRSNELKVTRMLLVISLLFFICITPPLIHTLLGNGLPGYNFFGYNSQLFKIFFSIYPIFDAINSTVNFIVYVFMSDNFRGTFISMFRCKSWSETT